MFVLNSPSSYQTNNSELANAVFEPQFRKVFLLLGGNRPIILSLSSTWQEYLCGTAMYTYPIIPKSDIRYEISCERMGVCELRVLCVCVSDELSWQVSYEAMQD